MLSSPKPPLLYSELVPGGHHWSNAIRRGTQMRFTAQGSRANLSLCLHNLEDKGERLNIPDTLKAQHTALLSRGHMLYSDMGRAMASIVEDSLGWHDSLCGPVTLGEIEARFGTQTYADARNAMFRGGREGLLIELGKYGLGARDLGPTLNLFSKVVVLESGELQFVSGHCKAGDSVVLRFEMDVLLAVSAAPHRLDTQESYAPADVLLELERAAPVAYDDFCRHFRPENERALQNTLRYYAR